MALLFSNRFEEYIIAEIYILIDIILRNRSTSGLPYTIPGLAPHYATVGDPSTPASESLYAQAFTVGKGAQVMGYKDPQDEKDRRPVETPWRFRGHLSAAIQAATCASDHVKAVNSAMTAVGGPSSPAPLGKAGVVVAASRIQNIDGGFSLGHSGPS
jgi:hypothetical protein